MRYIHKFKTDSDFQEEYNGEKYKEPWASWTVENDEVNYNKREGGVITVRTFRRNDNNQLEEVATITYDGVNVSFDELMEPTFEDYGSRRFMGVDFFMGEEILYNDDFASFACGSVCDSDLTKYDIEYTGGVEPDRSSTPGENILGDAGGPSPSGPEYPYDFQNQRFADYMFGETMVIIYFGGMIC